MDVIVITTSHYEEIVITFDSVEIKIGIIKSLQMRKSLNDRIVIVVVLRSWKFAVVGHGLIKIGAIVWVI